MSQALGFHKAATQDVASETLRRHARLFAVVYMTDKMLSLRLGRGSMIRDEEVPIGVQTMLKWVNTAPNKVPPGWVSFSRLQGLVYARLYSPEALQQPAQVREGTARDLIRQSDDILDGCCEINVRHSLMLVEGHCVLRWGKC